MPPQQTLGENIHQDLSDVGSASMAQGRNLQNLAPRPTQIDEMRHTGESVSLRFVSGGTNSGGD